MFSSNLFPPCSPQASLKLLGNFGSSTWFTNCHFYQLVVVLYFRLRGSRMIQITITCLVRQQEQNLLWGLTTIVILRIKPCGFNRQDQNLRRAPTMMTSQVQCLFLKTLKKFTREISRKLVQIFKASGWVFLRLLIHLAVFNSRLSSLTLCT